MVASGRKWVIMFVGESLHSLDDKGRLVLPFRIREGLGSLFYGFIDFDHCISLYTADGYAARAKKILALSEFSKEARQLRRTFFASSFEISCDKVGRILLPKTFLGKANIKKDIVLLGVYDHLELWDRAIHEENSVREDDEYLELAEKLSRGNKDDEQF